MLIGDTDMQKEKTQPIDLDSVLGDGGNSKQGTAWYDPEEGTAGEQ